MGSALLKSIFLIKSLISRINEVYVFSIKYRYSDILLKKNINFIYNRLFCCNYTSYCVGMVAVSSVSRYVISASRYQSRSSMYIRGLIPRIWPRQFQLPELMLKLMDKQIFSFKLKCLFIWTIELTISDLILALCA